VKFHGNKQPTGNQKSCDLNSSQSTRRKIDVMMLTPPFVIYWLHHSWKLEGTHRVRSHADDWLHHLANVNEARTKYPRSRKRLVTPPSEQNGLIDPVTLTFDLLTPKAYHLEYIPRSFPIQSLNTLGSFVFGLCCGQTDKHTDSKILPTPTDIVGVGITNVIPQANRCAFPN